MFISLFRSFILSYFQLPLPFLTSLRKRDTTIIILKSFFRPLQFRWYKFVGINIANTIFTIKKIFLSFFCFLYHGTKLVEKTKKNSQNLRVQTWYQYRILEKVTLHFHVSDRISKAYPLQSLKIKKGFKDGSGCKKRGIPEI